MSLTNLTKKFQAEKDRQNFDEDLEFVKKAEAGADIPVSDMEALAKVLRVRVSELCRLVN